MKEITEIEDLKEGECEGVEEVAGTEKALVCRSNYKSVIHESFSK